MLNWKQSKTSVSAESESTGLSYIITYNYTSQLCTLLILGDDIDKSFIFETFYEAKNKAQSIENNINGRNTNSIS